MYVAHERRAYILRLLQQRGSVRSAALAQELGVTDETIRTDLVAMQAEGLLERMHGGARYILPLEKQASRESARLDFQLAALAAQYISPGERLFLDDSAYALALLAALHDKPCAVITPSVNTMHRLRAAALPHEIICTGGILDKACGLLLPQQPEALLRELRVDTAILSPPALRAHAAAFEHPTQALWARAASQAAARTLALTPTAALSQVAPHTIEMSPALLITEDNLPPGFEGIATETVPYIAPEDVIPRTDFDY